MTTEVSTAANAVADLVDLERFKSYYSALYADSLAICTDGRFLVSKVNLPSSIRSNPIFGDERDSTANEPPGNGPIQSIEFADSQSRVSVMVWLKEDVLCVGFESGLVQGYSIGVSDGKGTTQSKELFEFLGDNSMVVSIRLFEERGTRKLWILYEEGLMIMVRITVF